METKKLVLQVVFVVIFKTKLAIHVIVLRRNHAVVYVVLFDTIFHVGVALVIASKDLFNVAFNLGAVFF